MSVVGETDSPWPVVLSRIAFILTLAIVIARALMSETIREGFDVVPGSMATPAAPGPGVTLFLNALCCLPALIVLIRRAIERPFMLRWTWSQVFLGLLALWAAASVAWASDKYTAVISASTLVAGAVLVWSTQQLVRSWMRLRLVAGVAVGLLLAYGVQGLVYKFVDVPENIAFWEKNKERILRERGWEENSFQARQFARKLIGGEMIGFNTSPNSYAAVIVMLSTIALGAAIQRRAQGDGWASSITLLAAVVPALVALYFTHTRTAAATLFLAVATLAALSSRGLRDWLAAHARLAYAGGAVIAALGVAAVIGHGVFHGSLPGASLNFRWRYWVAGWSLFQQHPLTGVGWANFGDHYVSTRLAAAAEEVRDPHNFLVRAFVELGIVGGALAIAWIARAAWELTRPTLPATPAASSTGSGTFAVAMILSIAGGGALMNLFAAVDFSQDSSYLIVETFRRGLFLGLICVAVVLVAIRGPARQELDDRPAPWLLYAFLVGLGVFLVHNFIDFVIAEPGAMTMFTVFLGAALGLRTPSAAGLKPRRPAALVFLGVAVVAWLIAMLILVIPVADAEQRARRADDEIRGDREKFRPSRPDIAAGMFEAIFQSLPYNADYAYRAAHAHIIAGSSPEKVKAMLGVAIATEPTNVGYRLTRAGVEMRQPQPDADAVRADFEAAVDLDPHNIRARLDYADALQKLNDPGGAAEQIRLALETNRLYDTAEPKRLPEAEVERLRKFANELESGASTGPA